MFRYGHRFVMIENVEDLQLLTETSNVSFGSKLATLGSIENSFGAPDLVSVLGPPLVLTTPSLSVSWPLRGDTVPSEGTRNFTSNGITDSLFNFTLTVDGKPKLTEPNFS